MRHAAFILTAIAASACAVAAFAAPQHLTDVQYIEANRCVGLMTSKQLGEPDVAQLEAYVETQGWSRIPIVEDEADQAREQGHRDAGRARGYTLSQLTAERDGVCHSFLAATTAAASPRSQRSLQ